MSKNLKDEQIIIRIEKIRKTQWKKTCTQKNISVSNLIIASVENKLLNDETNAILDFIEKQDNIFVKIETNINQVAKIINSQKFIKPSQLILFTEQLEKINDLKKSQNRIFENIYQLLAK